MIVWSNNIMIFSVLLSILVFGLLWISSPFFYGGLSPVCSSDCNPLTSILPVFGNKIILFGIGTYVWLFLMTFFIKIVRDKKLVLITLAGFLSATCIGIGLALYQWLVLREFCSFCFITHSTTLLATALFYRYVNIESQHSNMNWPKAFEVTLIAFAVASFVSVAFYVNFPSRDAVPQQKEIGKIGNKTITLDLLDKNGSREIEPLNEALYKYRKQALEYLMLQEAANADNTSLFGYLKSKVGEDLPLNPDEKRAVIVNPNNEDLFKLTIERIHFYGSPSLYFSLVRNLSQENQLALPKPGFDPIKVRDNSRGSYVKGKRSAPIKIIKFSDFDCPACQYAYQQLESLYQAYPDKISIEFRNYPLPNHQNAKIKARAAFCAGKQDKFWEAAEHLFANQKSIRANNLIQHMQSIGVNVDSLQSCMSNEKTSDAIEQDIEEGNRIHVMATPTLIINGKLYKGYPGNGVIQSLLAQ